MEKSVTSDLRVNPTVKQRAEDVLSRLGIAKSTAIDMHLNQISLTGGDVFPERVRIMESALQRCAGQKEPLWSATVHSEPL